MKSQLTQSVICEDASKAEQAKRLAHTIAEQLNEAIAERGHASIAFSGGSTPDLMFAALARQSVDWSKVSITLVDERCVPLDHARSNARLLKQNLLSLLPQQAGFVPLFKPDESSSERTARLGLFPLPFDVVHLGMGTDAHTASFFPDAPNIAEMLDLDNPALIATTRSESSQEQRLTWTLPALLKSRQIVVQLVGREKREVIDPVVELLGYSEFVSGSERIQRPMLALLEHTQLARPDGVPVTIYYAEE